MSSMAAQARPHHHYHGKGYELALLWIHHNTHKRDTSLRITWNTLDMYTYIIVAQNLGSKDSMDA